jgi:ferric-dicitrate binding protein FerR (iron transport regulator)
MNLQEQMEKLRKRQAAEWYGVMRSGEADAEALEKFGAWIAESPLNSAAYLKIIALSRETRLAAREAGLSGYALIPRLDPKVFQFAESGAEPGAPVPTLQRVRTWHRSMAIAGACLLAIASVSFGFLNAAKPYTTQTANNRPSRWLTARRCI